jgi:hypothetical protein
MVNRTSSTAGRNGLVETGAADGALSETVAGAFVAVELPGAGDGPVRPQPAKAAIRRHPIQRARIGKNWRNVRASQFQIKTDGEKVKPGLVRLG